MFNEIPIPLTQGYAVLEVDQRAREWFNALPVVDQYAVLKDRVRREQRLTGFNIAVHVAHTALLALPELSSQQE